MRANAAAANTYASVEGVERARTKQPGIIWPKNRCASFLLFSRRGAEAQR